DDLARRLQRLARVAALQAQPDRRLAPGQPRRRQQVGRPQAEPLQLLQPAVDLVHLVQLLLVERLRRLALRAPPLLLVARAPPPSAPSRSCSRRRSPPPSSRVWPPSSRPAIPTRNRGRPRSACRAKNDARLMPRRSSVSRASSSRPVTRSSSASSAPSRRRGSAAAPAPGAGGGGEIARRAPLRPRPSRSPGHAPLSP